MNTTTWPIEMLLLLMVRMPVYLINNVLTI